MILLCSVLVVSTVGCRNIQDNKELSPQDTQKEIKKVSVKEYDLGEVTLSQAYGDNYPVRLHGEIGIPVGDEESYPVVFILHGSHPITTIETERYDKGFTYLIEKLASAGYITVTMNVNAQYSMGYYGEPYGYERLMKIFNAHLEALTKAVAGENMGYGMDLTNRADLHQIHLIGHSRSGQGIFAIYHDQRRKGEDSIKSLIALAPSLWIILADPYPNVPVGVIIPELDGDVSTLDGQDIYDELRTDKARQSWESLVYLYGANHNFFNEELDSDTNRESAFSISLTGEQQRQFFANYAVDFLNTVKGVEVKEPFDISHNTVGQLYGHKVLTSLQTHDSLTILSASDDINLSNVLGGAISRVDADVIPLVNSSFYKEDTAQPFTPPGNMNISIINMSWSMRGGRVTLAIPDEYKDISDYDVLSLYLAIDSPSVLNMIDKNQAFSVEIEDKNGVRGKVILGPDTPALEYQPGKVITYEEPYVEYWSNFTPLSSVRIQLNEFENIDVTQVQAIHLIFDQSTSGSIMVADMSLMKK